MFKNSNELLGYALRELQVAVKENKSQVKILLEESFTNDINSVRKYCDSLEIKTITEILREEFKDYDIGSTVGPNWHLTMAITYKSGPCEMFYPLVWKLTLRKK